MGHRILRFLGWLILMMRIALPPLIRFVWRLVRGATLLALAEIGGIVAGIPQGTQRLADTWSKRIEEWGISPQTTDRLNSALRVWGFIHIFMGWVFIVVVVGIIVKMII